jgi:bifunctional DNA-binding transcriptional regulator/antitoxin component of YhaV-PrlF toxin-antitoxin module
LVVATLGLSTRSVAKHRHLDEHGQCRRSARARRGLDEAAEPSYSLPVAENVKRKTGRSRISSKHQVTIPAAAFRGAGFKAGDTVRIEAEGAGRVVLTKVDDLVDRYSGTLATGGELRRGVQALRDEW